jgi:hypothetical protein
LRNQQTTALKRSHGSPHLSPRLRSARSRACGIDASCHGCIWYQIGPRLSWRGTADL